MLSTFPLATVTQLLAAELMLQPHYKGSKLGNHTVKQQNDIALVNLGLLVRGL